MYDPGPSDRGMQIMSVLEGHNRRSKRLQSFRDNRMRIVSLVFDGQLLQGAAWFDEEELECLQNLPSATAAFPFVN
jgi:hypothetical protein